MKSFFVRDAKKSTIKRFVIQLCIILFLALTLGSMAAKCQDTRLQFAGNSIQVFNGLGCSAFSSSTPKVYIFATKPNQTIVFYLGISSNTLVSGNYQVMVTANLTAQDFTNNQSQWAALPTYSVQGGYSNTGSVIAISSIAAGTIVTISTPQVSAGQVALLLKNFTGACNVGLNASLVDNGTLQTQTVQGITPNSGNIQFVNPVPVSGLVEGAQTQAFMRVDAQGKVELSGGNNPCITMMFTCAASNRTGQFGSATAASSIQAVIPFNYDGGATGADTVSPSRNVTKLHAVSATATGNTAVWTPAAGTKFVVTCVGLNVDGNSTQTTGGDITIQLEDGTTPIVGFLWTVFVPSTAGSGGELLDEPISCFPNGFISSTTAQALNVNLSSALTAGHVTIRVYGQEATN